MNRLFWPSQLSCLGSPPHKTTFNMSSTKGATDPSATSTQDGQLEKPAGIKRVPTLSIKCHELTTSEQDESPQSNVPLKRAAPLTKPPGQETGPTYQGHDVEHLQTPILSRDMTPIDGRSIKSSRSSFYDIDSDFSGSDEEGNDREKNPKRKLVKPDQVIKAASKLKGALHKEQESKSTQEQGLDGATSTSLPSSFTTPPIPTLSPHPHPLVEAHSRSVSTYSTCFSTLSPIQSLVSLTPEEVPGCTTPPPSVFEFSSDEKPTCTYGTFPRTMANTWRRSQITEAILELRKGSNALAAAMDNKDDMGMAMDGTSVVPETEKTYPAGDGALEMEEKSLSATIHSQDEKLCEAVQPVPDVTGALHNLYIPPSSGTHTTSFEDEYEDEGENGENDGSSGPKCPLLMDCGSTIFMPKDELANGLFRGSRQSPLPLV
ncbi:hypothetical protein DFH27DRAFT_565780 [Peziza echinospora]|nr:hypothetical protein DFH27DRAFT_565780 [Peziza echinospora]